MNDNRDYMRAMLAAYTEVTGIELVVDLDRDYDRQKTLRELDKRKLTPDDMRAVMHHLKALVESTDPRYTDSSLLFSNAVGKRGDVGKFQERAMLLRARRAKKAATRPAGQGASEYQRRLAESAKAADAKLGESKQ